jgi:hypothetical protein
MVRDFASLGMESAGKMVRSREPVAIAPVLYRGLLHTRIYKPTA